MTCPICESRKAKRFCPAKFERICAVCCGEQREVTIDCPSDCPHLVASRHYDEDRRIWDRDKLPFSGQRIPSSILELHEELLSRLVFVIAEFASEHPTLIDSGAHAVLAALVETWQSLAKGIIFERPPADALSRELYDRLKGACEEYRGEKSSGLVGALSTRDGEIRDVLIAFAQIAAMNSNGRPKGRAFLDFCRSRFAPGTFRAPEAGRIIMA